MAQLDATALQLQPHHLAMVRNILREHIPDAEVWAYGSRVKGGSYAASDLDLVVRDPDDVARATTATWAVNEAFIESDLPIQVQIVDWARIPDSFHDEIEDAYVILQQPLKTAVVEGTGK